MDRITILKEMLAEDPADSFIWFAIAKEHEKTDPQTAIDTYLHLRSLDASYVGLYYHLGKMYELKGEKQLAIDTYSEGILVAKKQSDFHSISELNNAKVNLEME
ncbi:MAG TPA: tetratricopeptide repeat protein [Saprospiraceae bacterium]|nr:tetratricopeptide repeat protein [Saprospiraceae bacterium]HPN69331.1 tetratricopeptide repeat protein [Saprospiraceae bacterium]